MHLQDLRERLLAEALRLPVVAKIQAEETLKITS
jgi:hypothetical protein